MCKSKQQNQIKEAVNLFNRPAGHILHRIKDLKPYKVPHTLALLLDKSIPTARWQLSGNSEVREGVEWCCSRSIMIREYLSVCDRVKRPGRY